MGPRLEHYEILSALGSGAMSSVWKARDRRSGTLVALKVLHPQLALSPSSRERFLHEVEAYERLRHVNVIACLGGGRDGEHDYVALELLEGGDLRGVLRAATRIPTELAGWIANEILNGLDHAHAVGVFHRDVKPENVMVGLDGHLKLADFGISTAVDFPRLTVAGQLLGTPAYMSPSRIDGEAADIASDLWSVGVILYEMVTGTTPFAADTFEATVARVKRRTPPPLGYRIPDVPEELEVVVAGLLSRDADARFKSAREAVEKLKPLLSRATSWASAERLLALIAEPVKTRQAWAREHAAVRLSKARSLLKGDAPRHEVARLEALLALLIDPSSAEAEALVAALKSSSSAPPSPLPGSRIRELEREAEDGPGNVIALVNLVRAARAAGDEVMAAAAYRWGRRRSGGDRFAFAQLASAIGFEVASYLEGTSAEQLQGRLQGGAPAAIKPPRPDTARTSVGLWIALMVAVVAGLWSRFPNTAHAPRPLSSPRPTVSPSPSGSPDPAASHVFLDQAQYASDCGDLDRALSIYRRFLHSWPGHRRAGEATFRVARVLEDLGRSAEAANEYQELLALHADSDWAPAARIRLSRLLALRGELEAAIRVVDPLSQHGDREERLAADVERAGFLFLLSRPDDALALYQAVLAADPLPYLKARAHLGVGRILAMRGDPGAWVELTAAIDDGGESSLVGREASELRDTMPRPR